MSIVINYTKQAYVQKINELEGYRSLLEQHLSRMTDLKKSMDEFWADEQARKAGFVLNSMINRVQNTMDQTSKTLIFYRSAVDKFNQVGIFNNDLLEKAIALIGGIGGR